jgi:ornithine--oxo-acid transaminase
MLNILKLTYLITLIMFSKIAFENVYLARNYAPLPVVLKSGFGPYLWDINNKQYYDFLSSYSANNQGHCHSHIINALETQARELTLTSRAFHHNRLGQLGEKMSVRFGFDKILPMNTGVEAGETAVKICRKWGYEKKGVSPNSARLLFPKNNFWGRTISASSTQCELDGYHNFGPFTPNLDLVPFNDIPSLRKEFETDPNIVGFFFEPIQGEAGVIIPDDDYIQNVRELCDEFNVLMIADEVQTGMGRTGKLYACEDIKPDILILGKALGGGVYPVSAVLANDNIMEVMTPGTHGSTFGGNPLACAVANASIDILLHENMVENSANMGKLLRDGLNNIAKHSDIITDVRGKGLMNAIEVIDKQSCDNIVSNLANNDLGILCKSTRDNIIRLSPPLVISKHHIEEVLSIFDSVIYRESEYKQTIFQISHF